MRIRPESSSLGYVAPRVNSEFSALPRINSSSTCVGVSHPRAARRSARYVRSRPTGPAYGDARTVVTDRRVCLHDAGHASIVGSVESRRLCTRDRLEHADEIAAIRRGRRLHRLEAGLPAQSLERGAIEIIEVREMKSMRRRNAARLDVRHLDEQHALARPSSARRRDRIADGSSTCSSA